MNAFKGSWVVLALILTGCGGGSGSDEPSQVSASGADVQVTEKTEVTLNAQASPAGGTFNWQVISGAKVSEFPITEQQAAFVAPDIKADVNLLIQVDYVAPDGSLASDQVTVAIKSNNQLPIPSISQSAPETCMRAYEMPELVLKTF